MTEGAGETARAPGVRFADAEPNGLASMVGDLIEQNLARKPSRARLLTGGSATLVAPDAGVEATGPVRSSSRTDPIPPPIWS